MELIGIPEAADIIKRDRTTLWRWVEEKKLRPVMIVGKGQRKRALFDRTYIEEFAANHSKQQDQQEVA